MELYQKSGGEEGMVERGKDCVVKLGKGSTSNYSHQALGQISTYTQVYLDKYLK